MHALDPHGRDVHGRDVVDGALLAGERQRRSSTGDKVARKVDVPSGALLRLAFAWLDDDRGSFMRRRRVPGWRLVRSVRHVDRGGRHACALELLPVARTMFAHYASKTLTTIRLHPTRLETRTKESNMCASLRVIETRGRNESKGRLRRLR